MLWSDRPDEPPQELRAAQAMLRRGAWVVAILLPTVLVVVVAWPR
jgi:hypothetical protein